MSSLRWVAGIGAGLMLSCGAAHAQGSFAGRWRVEQVTRPTWVDPARLPAKAHFRVGESIVFGRDSVTASGAVGCAHAQYERVEIEPRGLFQGAIEDADKAAAVAREFGLASPARTLRVNCDTGSFDYHDGSKGLVIQYDNLVYTFVRAAD